MAKILKTTWRTLKNCNIISIVKHETFRSDGDENSEKI